MTKIEKIRNLLEKLREKLEAHDQVIGFIVYGSFSENTPHQPTQYSDLDAEIVVQDENYKDFVAQFRSWFEENFEPILIETRVGHLNKIFVTENFLDLQFHISAVEDFNRIDERSMNYFPNGYTLLFDKSEGLEAKIQSTIKPTTEKTPQQKFDSLNNSFWYFVQGISPYLGRQEYWFAAASYWAWLFNPLCKVLRVHFDKDVKNNNPMKHFEQDMSAEIVARIQPLRNLETPEDLKIKLQLVIALYSEFAQKVCTKKGLHYDLVLEQRVTQYIQQYLS